MGQQQQFYLVPLAPRTSPWLTTLPATPALLTHSTSLRFLPLTTRVFVGLDHTCDLQHHIRIVLIIFLKLPLNVQRTAQSFFLHYNFFLSLLLRTSNGQDNHPSKDDIGLFLITFNCCQFCWNFLCSVESTALFLIGQMLRLCHLWWS